jgi:hypothetical protein
MANYSKGELKLAFWRRFQAAWAARGIEMPMDEIMATMKVYYARGRGQGSRKFVLAGSHCKPGFKCPTIDPDAYGGK